MPNSMRLIGSISFINTWLLIFNILPIFPLDGGQILRSLLWYPFGRARSLLIATVLGFVGAAAFIFFAYRVSSTWLLILAVFMVWNCWAGLKHALVLLKMSEDTATRGLRLSHLQHSAAARRALGMWKLQAGLRHLRYGSGVPALWSAICRNALLRLRPRSSHESVGAGRDCSRPCHGGRQSLATVDH